MRNNVLDVLEDLGGESARLRAKEGEATSTELSFPQISEWLRLSFAQTYVSCQGTEFSDTLRLHDTSNVLGCDLANKCHDLGEVFHLNESTII